MDFPCATGRKWAKQVEKRWRSRSKLLGFLNATRPWALKDTSCLSSAECFEARLRAASNTSCKEFRLRIDDFINTWKMTGFPAPRGSSSCRPPRASPHPAPRARTACGSRSPGSSAKAPQATQCLRASGSASPMALLRQLARHVVIIKKLLVHKALGLRKYQDSRSIIGRFQGDDANSIGNNMQ